MVLAGRVPCKRVGSFGLVLAEKSLASAWVPAVAFFFLYWKPKEEPLSIEVLPL